MKSTSVILSIATFAVGAVAAPRVSVIPRALGQAEAPCDAWSDECREVITANACFAAYITGTDVAQILDCVDVEDDAVAERKICNCYGCAETTVQNWAVNTLGCSAPEAL